MSNIILYFVEYLKSRDMIHKHHNRILSVIRNKSNKSIHLQPIRNMVDNFDKMFPFSFQLSNNLLKEFFKLQNRVL